MRISATGRVNNRPGTATTAGFTLLEVLVVLVIISVIISLAVLAIDTGPKELRREGNRIASLLELASEEAVMNGREYRAVLRRHGYSFELLREGKWQSAADDLFRPRQLPDGLSLQLFLENREIPLNDEEDPETAETGALLILSSGEITPFEIIVSGPSTAEVRIQGNGSEIATFTP